MRDFSRISTFTLNEMKKVIDPTTIGDFTLNEVKGDMRDFSRISTFTLLRVIDPTTIGDSALNEANKKRGKMKKKIKKIIFMCKYNAFRSRVAESYFNKINKNKGIKAISRGFIMGGASDLIQKSSAQKQGINISGNPKPINLKELIKADFIILVANDIPRIMFDYQLEPISKKVVVWNIKDEQRMNKKNIEKIISEIKKRVEELNNKLNKK